VSMTISNSSSEEGLVSVGRAYVGNSALTASFDPFGPCGSSQGR
jgi:hypothetical protein